MTDGDRMAEAGDPVAGRLRCRPISIDDLGAVVELLCRGFRERSAAYWRDGLDRQAQRLIPEGCPRFGYVLVAGSRMVGVVLTLYAESRDPSGQGPWCNLSSWYVEPGYRPYATLLDRMALRHTCATFTNISPAPHTLAMHGTRGFVPSSQGQIIAFPLLGRREAGVTVRAYRRGDTLDDLPQAECRLVRDHADYGCIVLIGRDDGGSRPFVFIRHPIQAVKWRLGFSPLHYMQLVYCRSTLDLPRFSRPIGVHLLTRHRAVCVVADADEPIEGLKGHYRAKSSMRLKRGADRVRPGDLAYTELVIFGP